MNINIKRSVENDGEDILKCFLKGYQMNIAKRQIDSSYQNLNCQNQKIYIHPSSVLYNSLPEYVIYDEIIYNENLYMKNVSSIKKEWINEICDININGVKTKKVKKEEREKLLQYIKSLQEK